MKVHREQIKYIRFKKVEIDISELKDKTERLCDVTSEKIVSFLKYLSLRFGVYLFHITDNKHGIDMKWVIKYNENGVQHYSSTEMLENVSNIE